MKRSSLFRVLLSTVLNRPKTLALAPLTMPLVLPQHPLTSDRDGWKAHWIAQGQPWRTEPEIDVERQKYLAERREITPDIEKGIYPFRDIKLSRADVEWLLATHENGRGPINWDDESQKVRKGIDIRGADLRRVSLRYLPLASICGGLFWSERNLATKEQRKMAAVHMEGAKLYRANLNHAILHDAHLEEVVFARALLEEAQLRGAYLDRAKFDFAHLKGAYLRDASLIGTNLRDAYLEGARLINVVISDERRIGPLIADAHWDDVNLAVVNWSQVNMLGDEHEARQNMQLKEFKIAIRANRQLALALQAQGLNEDSARFAFRAQVLQRKVLWREHKFLKWLGSAILALLAGYGYRMWRIIAAYLIIVTVCAVAYFILGIYFSPHISPSQAFLESVMAFHGRVFYELFNPGEPQIWVTAFEAIAGLVIEGVFIAMLAQRFFGK